jgi:phosphatidylglycerol:prolipoprotein diacylglycerol transferase
LSRIQPHGKHTDVHPILFTAFGTAVPAYAASTVLAYALAVVIGIALGLKDGRDLRDLIEMGLVVVISAVLGAKVFHTVFEAKGHDLGDGRIAASVWELLAVDPWHWARLFEPGYAFYGGAVFGTGFAYLFAVRRELPNMGAFGDYAVPGFALAMAIGRVGCFLAGCCYGGPTTSSLGVVFPAGHPSHGVPVHPVQLYEALFCFSCFVASIALWRRRRFGGELFCAWVVAYAVWRLLIEFLRDDADRGMWLGGTLSTSQLVSLAALPVAVFFWVRALRRARRDVVASPEAS